MFVGSAVINRSRSASERHRRLALPEKWCREKISCASGEGQSDSFWPVSGYGQACKYVRSYFWERTG